MHVLAKEKRTKISRLLKIEGSLTEQDLEQGKRWAQALMDAAYAGQSLSDGTHAVVLEITCGRMW